MIELSRPELQAKVCQIIAEMFEIPLAKLTPAAKLFEELGLDSIDAVDLVVKVQELTGRRVDEADLRRVRTVEDVVNIVEAHLKKAA